MKHKLTIIALAIAALTSSAYAADLKGGISATASSSSVTGNYGDGHNVGVDGYLKLSEDTVVRAGVIDLHAWKNTATVGTVGVQHQFTDRIFVDASLAGSDRGQIAPESRVTVVGGYRATERKNVVLSAGVDHIEMRGGNKSDALLLQALYYVPGVPVVLQADGRFTTSKPGDRHGERYGVAATYGKVGEWTATARVDSGHEGYESFLVPGQLVDFNSNHAALTGRYWVAKNWGFQASFDTVNNKYYTRHEVRSSVFYDF